jgi:hypothetical protein
MVGYAAVKIITSQYARSNAPAKQAGARHHHRLATRGARKSIAAPRASGMKLQPMSSQVSCAGMLALRYPTPYWILLADHSSQSPAESYLQRPRNEFPSGYMVNSNSPASSGGA